MTRTGPGKPVDESFWRGRLENARAYLESARTLADLAVPGDNANPVVSLIVSAAVGYADALVAATRGEVNQKDHQAAARALRAALGNRLPVAQERALARILREKDAAQYSARHGNLTHARSLLEELTGFAAWAETELRR